MTTKSVRANMVPTGGVGVTTEMGQSVPLLPNTATMVQISEMFSERSEQNCIKLNQVTLQPGQQTGFIINNVGLGESLELYIEGEVKLVNTAAAGQAVSIAPEFPFNLISNIFTQFNGQTVLNSLSGYELLGVMAKRSKNLFYGAAASAGSKFAQSKARVDKAMAYIEAGNADTTLTAGDGLTGISSVTIAASKTGSIKFGFYVELPYTLRKDILLGLIPMQNNSIYANVNITVPGLLGTTPVSPFYVADAIPATLSVDNATSVKAQPTYNFWSIPAPNDPKLYSFLVSHSYMLLSQPNNPLNKTGSQALQYNMPNNYYLLSMLLTLRNSGGVLQDVYTKLDNPSMSYNGTAIVDRRDMKTRMARQFLNYEGFPAPLGQLIWDATDVSYLPNGTNTTKWLDMYLANFPQFVADVDATLSALPASFSVLREQLVPAQVQIV